MIQLVQNKKSKAYLVWMRWGRVGNVGQTTSFSCGNDLNKAKEIFCKKFYDKTYNEFADMALKSFEKYPGKYDLVEKDYGSDKQSNSDANIKREENNEQISIPPSKLDGRIQHLIELICNKFTI
jgi:poly [ADP-ribose] polymerase